MSAASLMILPVAFEGSARFGEFSQTMWSCSAVAAFG